MPLTTIIEDGQTGKHANLIPAQRDLQDGLMIYTENARELQFKTLRFNNEIHGSDMAVDVAPTGTEVVIHDGTDTAGWTGSALVGTWDFSDTTRPAVSSNCVSITAGTNGSSAKFDASGTVAMSSYVSFSGRIRLETYNVDTCIRMEFGLAGELVGNSVTIDNYIDTTIIEGTSGTTYQFFDIPKEEFGITSQTIDEMTLLLESKNGIASTIRFDELQIENTAGIQIWNAEPSQGVVYYVDKIRLIIIDALAGTVANGTMSGLVYNQILALGSLNIGLLFQRIEDGKIVTNFYLRNLEDMLFNGFKIVDSMSDGTNTAISVEFSFTDTQILDSRNGDKYRILISEDLSGLITLKAILHGKEEIIK